MSEQVVVDITVIERVMYGARMTMSREIFEFMNKGLTEKRDSELVTAKGDIAELLNKQKDLIGVIDLEIFTFEIIQN